MTQEDVRANGMDYIQKQKLKAGLVFIEKMDEAKLRAFTKQLCEDVGIEYDDQHNATQLFAKSLLVRDALASRGRDALAMAFGATADRWNELQKS